MSNIPEARRIIQAVLANKLDKVVRGQLEAALDLMTRKSPKWIAPRRLRTLNKAQRALCCELRAKGLAVSAIAQLIGTNHGRVSEAINA